MEQIVDIAGSTFPLPILLKQLASHELATIGLNVTKNKIPNSIHAIYVIR